MTDKTALTTESDDDPWIGTARRQSGLVELICKCGVGHPAPASVHWMELHGKEMMGVHGCCGCCRTPEWKLAAATRGYEKANEILKDTLAKYKQACALLAEKNEKIGELEGEIREIQELHDADLST